jgi:transcriptional regulator
MYTPKHFEETRTFVLHDLMRAMPLSTLAMVDPQGMIDANHIPLQVVAGPTEQSPLLLRGHVARANPLWQMAGQGLDCLAIFQGPQLYISPRWYASKAEHGKVVPTWNYAVVHARGTIRAIDDSAWLHEFLHSLTDEHESQVKVGKAWKVTDAPADYVETMRKAIVGIEICVTSLTGKWKTSQNQPAQNKVSLVNGLQHEAAAGGASNTQAMLDLVQATAVLPISLR